MVKILQVVNITLHHNLPINELQCEINIVCMYST
jgi:hypothetical protein